MLTYINNTPDFKTLSTQIPEQNLYEFVHLYVNSARLYPPLSKLDPTSPKDQVHLLVHEAGDAVLNQKHNLKISGN